MAVLFYEDSLNPDDLAESSYAQAIDRLAKQKFLPGDKVERLRTNEMSTYPIFSMRLSQKGRLLFTYFKHQGVNHPLLLDVLPDHEYDKSKYLNNPKLLETYFKKRRNDYAAEIARHVAEQTAEEANDEPHKPTKFVAVQIMGAHAIVPDENQAAITLPAIVEGPPGSGKTSVAMGMVAQHAHERILVVTRSKRLTDALKGAWAENPANLGEHSRVEILTYNELAKRALPRGIKLTPDGRAVFEKWFETYTTATDRKGKGKRNEKRTAETVWQEFRTCSGFQNGDDYLDAGKKQTMFEDREDREWVVAAYDAWQKHCDAKNFHIEQFIAFKQPEDDNQYDMVIVDESQDLSGENLSNLMRLAKNKQIAYCLDSRQSLEDDNPKTIFLQKLFHDSGIVVKPTQLTMTYRSSPNVMRLARSINNLRIKVTPEKKQEAPIEVAETNAGDVVFFDVEAGKSESQAQIARIQNNPDVCIITTAEQKAALSAKGYLQVFTPDEVKGLQYKEVILYNIFSEQVFKAINTQLGNEAIEENSEYAKHLSAVFTAMTRAEDGIYVYQENPHPVRHILNGMKKFETGGVKEKDQKEVTEEGWFERAKELYETEVKSNKEKAIKILKEKTKQYGDVIVDWENELTKNLGEESKTVDENIEKEWATRCKRKQPRQRFLCEKIDQQDLQAIEWLLNQDKEVDWDEESKEGVRTIDLLCTEQNARTISLLTILMKKGANPNHTSRYFKFSAFVNAVNAGNYQLADVIHDAGDFDLGVHAFTEESMKAYAMYRLKNDDGTVYNKNTQILDYLYDSCPEYLVTIAFEVAKHHNLLTKKDVTEENFLLHLKEDGSSAEKNTIIEHIAGLVDDASTGRVFTASHQFARFHYNRLQNNHYKTDSEKLNAYNEIVDSLRNYDKATLDDKLKKILDESIAAIKMLQESDEDSEQEPEDTSDQYKLGQFIENRDINSIDKLINDETLILDWNQEDSSGLTTLQMLASNNDIRASILIHQLIRNKKADVNAVPRHGHRSAFYTALRSTNDDLLRAFLLCESLEIEKHATRANHTTIPGVAMMLIHRIETNPMLPAGRVVEFFERFYHEGLKQLLSLKSFKMVHPNLAKRCEGFLYKQVTSAKQTAKVKLKTDQERQLTIFIRAKNISGILELTQAEIILCDLNLEVDGDTPLSLAMMSDEPDADKLRTALLLNPTVKIAQRLEKYFHNSVFTTLILVEDYKKATLFWTHEKFNLRDLLPYGSSEDNFRFLTNCLFCAITHQLNHNVIIDYMAKHDHDALMEVYNRLKLEKIPENKRGADDFIRSRLLERAVKLKIPKAEYVTANRLCKSSEDASLPLLQRIQVLREAYGLLSAEHHLLIGESASLKDAILLKIRKLSQEHLQTLTPDERLKFIIKNEDFDSLSHILSEGSAEEHAKYDWNTTDPVSKYTILMTLCLRQPKERVEHLLSKLLTMPGIDINFCNEKGTSAFILSVIMHKENPDVYKMLFFNSNFDIFKSLCDENAKNYDSRTKIIFTTMIENQPFMGTMLSDCLVKNANHRAYKLLTEVLEVKASFFFPQGGNNIPSQKRARG